jgi:hypothetical protein
VVSWFETRGVAGLLTMRARRPHPERVRIFWPRVFARVAEV